jgi:hypothetical protein
MWVDVGSCVVTMRSTITQTTGPVAIMCGYVSEKVRNKLYFENNMQVEY